VTTLPRTTSPKKAGSARAGASGYALVMSSSPSKPAAHAHTRRTRKQEQWRCPHSARPVPVSNSDSSKRGGTLYTSARKNRSLTRRLAHCRARRRLARAEGGAGAHPNSELRVRAGTTMLRSKPFFRTDLSRSTHVGPSRPSTRNQTRTSNVVLSRRSCQAGRCPPRSPASARCVL